MKMKLEISFDLTYRILTDHFSYRKVRAHFMTHKLTDYQKLRIIQHCKDIVKATRKDEKFLYNTGTADDTWYFPFVFMIQRSSFHWAQRLTLHFILVF